MISRVCLIKAWREIAVLMALNAMSVGKTDLQEVQPI